MPKIQTQHLCIGYEEAGRVTGQPIVLLHGWPDDVRCWDRITPRLAERGCRVIAPYLRGCGPTRFLSSETMRSGAIAALGQDLIEFLEALALENVLLVGYDWGARAAYVAGALCPERLRGLVVTSAGYATSKPIAEMSYELARAYWYEWFVAFKQGCEAIEKDRRRLCRFLWESWSPHWRFADEEFAAAAPSWDNPDWASISVHAYLQRWGEAAGAPEHEALEQRLAQAPPIQVSTIMLQGLDDRDNMPETSVGKERYFMAGYERRELDGIGHFVPREAPERVLEAVEQMLDQRTSS